MCVPLVAAMAQGEPAGFGYWTGVLVNESGLPFRQEVPPVKRRLFRKLARFLVENDFVNVSELRGGQPCSGAVCVCGTMLRLCACAGSDPSRWMGAGQLTNEELDYLRPLVARSRSRSPVAVRCVCYFLSAFIGYA